MGFSDHFLSLIIKARDFIFPFRCLNCNDWCDQEVCHSCIGEVNFVEQPYCQLCNIQVAAGSELCSDCVMHPPTFKSLRAAIFYNKNSKEIIQGFKFKDKPYAAQLFSQWMIKAGADILGEVDIIVPVPVHRMRLLLRGFNQSSLLATLISKHTNITVDHLVLLRIKNNTPQSMLPISNQRLNNVRNSFAVNDNCKIKGKNILLIDDVVTTGATLVACTKALIKMGVESVNILSLAKRQGNLLIKS